VAKTGYGRTVLNIQGKEIPNDSSRYRETARPETYLSPSHLYNDLWPTSIIATWSATLQVLSRKKLRTSVEFKHYRAANFVH